MATLHCQGVRTISFIDDILVIAASDEECLDNITTTISLLESLAFVINYEKSVLKPSQSLTFLGFIINTVSDNYFYQNLR